VAYRDGVAHARRQYHDLLQRLSFDEPTFAALQQTVNLCAQNRVRVALLLMPEGSEFRSWYPPHVEVDLSARLADVGERFDAAVIDARAWLDDGAFSDSHHMLPAAAEVFSQRLGRAIVPLLRSREPSMSRVDRRFQARLLK
jgi:hypothetical protein